MVFAVAGRDIAGITGFAGKPHLYPLFDLPPELPASADSDPFLA
jgi:predicted cobalt transporter CbtA